MIRWSENGGKVCPADNASESRLPAPLSGMPPFCCWMKRRRHWTRRANSLFRKALKTLWAAARRLLWRTGFPPSKRRIGFMLSREEKFAKKEGMTSWWPGAACMEDWRHCRRGMPEKVWNQEKYLIYEKGNCIIRLWSGGGRNTIMNFWKGAWS